MQYTIQKGDTLNIIAKFYGVSVDEIMNANIQIKNRDKIRAGDTIEIPSTVKGSFLRLWAWYKQLFSFI
jgi:LysM repeat protein